MCPQTFCVENLNSHNTLNYEFDRLQQQKAISG